MCRNEAREAYCGTVGDTPLGNGTLTIGVFADWIRGGLTVATSSTNVGTLATSTTIAIGVTSTTASSVTGAFWEHTISSYIEWMKLK